MYDEKYYLEDKPPLPVIPEQTSEDGAAAPTTDPLEEGETPQLPDPLIPTRLDPDQLPAAQTANQSPSLGPAPTPPPPP